MPFDTICANRASEFVCHLPDTVLPVIKVADVFYFSIKRIIVVYSPWSARHIASDCNKIFIENQDVITIILIGDVAVNTVSWNIFIRRIMDATDMFDRLNMRYGPISDERVFIGLGLLLLVRASDKEERYNQKSQYQGEILFHNKSMT